MRHLKSILIALAATALILIGIGYFLNSTYKIQKIKHINSVNTEVYSYVSDLKKWPIWTAWNKERYPGIVVNYSGSETGPGSIMSWKTDDGDEGQVKIIQWNPPLSLTFEVTLEENFVSKGLIKIVPKQSGSEVQWTMEGDVGNDFAARYFLLFADRLIGPDLEIGLENLKKNL